MNKRVILIFFLTVLFIFTSIVYWFRLGGGNTILLRNMTYLLFPLFAIVGGIFSLHKIGFQGMRARTVLFLLLGITCWFIGDVIWDIYENLLLAKPFPSIADISYLLAYPFLFSGMINEIIRANIRWNKVHKVLIYFITTVSIIFTFIVFYFGIYLAYDPKIQLINNIIAISYGIGDLLLIITNLIVLVLAWEFRSGRLSIIWITFFVSFIFQLIADILFAIYQGAYQAQIPLYRNSLDELWMLSYLIFTIGIFDFGFSVLEARKKIIHLG